MNKNDLEIQVEDAVEAFADKLEDVLQCSLELICFFDKIRTLMYLRDKAK